MSYQFIHIESYARVGSIQKGKSTKWGIQDIANEAMRKEGNCNHVENPQEPEIIFGVDAYEAANMAQEWADNSVDASGRKLRKDGSCLLAGVISFPDGRSEDEWRAFRDDSVDYLKDKYGDSLKSVVEHRDESHLHIHFYAVPEIGQKFDEIHDGKKAIMEAKEENPKILKGEQNKLYIEAMKDFQKDFYEEVAINHGMTKTGPKRERLTRDEWKERKEYALQQSEEIKNISLLKEEAIQQGKKEGFDFSVEQSKGWGFVDKVAAKYTYHKDGFQKKIDQKDEAFQALKEDRDNIHQKYKTYKKEYYEQKRQTDLALEDKKEKSKEIYSLTNENRNLQIKNDQLDVENIALKEDIRELNKYKITSEKMQARFPDEYQKMESAVNKQRPKGESSLDHENQTQQQTQQPELQEEQHNRPRPRF